jgi:hypothetical protein
MKDLTYNAWLASLEKRRAKGLEEARALCKCGNFNEALYSPYDWAARQDCEEFCLLGFDTREEFMLELLDNLFDRIICGECGAEVANKTRHVMWHLRLDKTLNSNFAEAWTIHFKTLTEA